MESLKSLEEFGDLNTRTEREIKIHVVEKNMKDPEEFLHQRFLQPTSYKLAHSLIYSYMTTSGLQDYFVRIKVTNF